MPSPLMSPAAMPRPSVEVPHGFGGKACGSGAKYKFCCAAKAKANRHGKFPIGTVAYYGPDDKTTRDLEAAGLLVPPGCACPDCGERRLDYLVWRAMPERTFWHSETPFVYGSFMLMYLLGRFVVRGSDNPVRILGTAVQIGLLPHVEALALEEQRRIGVRATLSPDVVST